MRTEKRADIADLRFEAQRTEEGGGPPDGGVRLSDFDYHLPHGLIAQVPASERDAARLLVLDRMGGPLRHARVRDLPSYLSSGDLLVFNDTRVFPARLRGQTSHGGKVELLLVGREQESAVWRCLGKPARRLRPGSCIGLPEGIRARVREAMGDGRYVVMFEPPVKMESFLAAHGDMPLPPYIRRPEGSTSLDRERYQTVFAAQEGSIAAPTAGLHFTEALLEKLRRHGVETAWLTLHVGPATFLPVRCEDVRRHPMEPEWAFVPETTVAAIERTKHQGHRVVAVGTTTTRALESLALHYGNLRAGEVCADAFIFPGFRFRVVDALLTNFHLPRSTLLLLVAAFAGREPILCAYETAVREGYRFYSYGDAMLIL